MKPSSYLELRDLDGSYIVALPLDECRCRVLWSNVALRGAVLAKASLWSWSQASEDIGGYTRVVPSDLDSAERTDSDPEGARLKEIVDPANREIPPAEEPEGGGKGLRHSTSSAPPRAFARLAREMAKTLRRMSGSPAGARRGYSPKLALGLWKERLSQLGVQRKAASLLAWGAARDGSAPLRIPQHVKRALLYRWKRLARRPLHR